LGVTVWAAAAVAIEVLVPIALILGFAPRLSALLLIAFVIAASATTHRYWEFAEPARRARRKSTFSKTLAFWPALLLHGLRARRVEYIRRRAVAHGQPAQ
jgi:putative oxidoreductase